MVYLAELSVCVTVRFKIVRIYARSVPRVHRQKHLDDDASTLLADSGINDRLVKLRSLIDQTSFEFIDVSYFEAVNFLPQNTPDAVFCLINHISVYCMLIRLL